MKSLFGILLVELPVQKLKQDEFQCLNIEYHTSCCSYSRLKGHGHGLGAWVRV